MKSTKVQTQPSKTEIIKKIVDLAAELLYQRTGVSYYQARNTARKQLGVSARYSPHLDEINYRLDELVQQRVDPDYRQALLMAMRREAMEWMTVLKQFSPKLIGSVWRGNIRIGSDIDIHVFSNDKNKIYQVLESKGLTYESKTEPKGIPHDIISFQGKDYQVQITVYPISEKDNIRVCNILRVPIKGFDIKTLEEVVSNASTS